MTGYKEKIEIYTKYLENKSNLVSGEYLRLHRWISQGDSHVELSILQVWTLVLQLGGDFTTWRWFCNLEMIRNFIRSLEVISQRGSQPRNIFVGHFTAHFTTMKWGGGAAKWHSCAWFVPNWCLSWFVSNWCSLIEGVIKKIYNLLHHLLG